MQKGSVALHSHQYLLFSLGTIAKYSLPPSYVMLCYGPSPVLKNIITSQAFEGLPALVLLIFPEIIGLLFGAQCFKGLVLGLKKLRMSFLGWRE